MALNPSNSSSLQQLALKGLNDKSHLRYNGFIGVQVAVEQISRFGISLSSVMQNSGRIVRFSEIQTRK